MRIFIFFIISLFSINTLYLFTIPEVNLRETYSPENIITNLKNKLRPSIRPLLVKIGLKEKVPNENKKKYENKNRIFVFDIKENNIKDVYNREHFVISLKELSENEFSILEGPASLRKNTITNFQDLFSLNTTEQIIKVFDGYKTRKHFHYTDASILNPISFLALLSSEWVHGERTSGGFIKKLDSIHKEHLSMTCGTVAFFVYEILKKINVRSRLVSTLTLNNWNSYDNGHTLVEVYVEKQQSWVLLDLSQKTIFKIKGSDKFANALELSTNDFENIEIIKLVNADVMDYTGYKMYGPVADSLFYAKRDWYRRMFQSFSIFDTVKEKWIFTNFNLSNEGENKISSYSTGYEVIDHKKFIEKFYIDS